MKNRIVNFETIARVDIIKGKSFADIKTLSDMLIDNSNRKLSDKSTSTRYEDTYCPDNEIVDQIIDEMRADFKSVTGHDIECIGYWGHIHEYNMSTNTHNHGDAYVSAVLHLSVPKGSGEITFMPRLNQYNTSMYRTSFPPEESSYYMFPGYLDHCVSRHKSTDKRVSISFNFEKV